MKESKNKIKKINVIFVAFKTAVLLLSVMGVIFLKKGETGLSLLMSSFFRR